MWTPSSPAVCVCGCGRVLWRHLGRKTLSARRRRTRLHRGRTDLAITPPPPTPPPHPSIRFDLLGLLSRLAASNGRRQWAGPDPFVKMSSFDVSVSCQKMFTLKFALKFCPAHSLCFQLTSSRTRTYTRDARDVCLLLSTV